jgi:hypothetical protein
VQKVLRSEFILAYNDQKQLSFVALSNIPSVITAGKSSNCAGGWVFSAGEFVILGEKCERGRLEVEPRVCRLTRLPIFQITTRRNLSLPTLVFVAFTARRRDVSTQSVQACLQKIRASSLDGVRKCGTPIPCPGDDLHGYER